MSIKRHNEKLSFRNIDYFFHLKIKRDLISKISTRYFSKNILDLGCGEMPYKGILLQNAKITNYIGIDIENIIYQKEIKPDFFWDGKNIPLESSSVNNCMLIEVLEHIPYPDVVLKELNRVLIKGGYGLITVPYLWTLHDIPNDEFRYTPFSLKRILENSGFEVIEIEALGGWSASLATFISLYIRRGLKVNRFIRNLLSIIFLPLVKYLYYKDASIPHNSFSNGLMITGLWCVIRKK